jgi:hypothetical protein
VGVKWWLLRKGFTLPLGFGFLRRSTDYIHVVVTPSRQGWGDPMHKTGLSKCHSGQFSHCNTRDRNPPQKTG